MDGKGGTGTRRGLLRRRHNGARADAWEERDRPCCVAHCPPRQAALSADRLCNTSGGLLAKQGRDARTQSGKEQRA